jgi:hypothetical protein
MKAHLRPDGGVANPRNAFGYCCGLCLALGPDTSLSSCSETSAAQHQPHFSQAIGDRQMDTTKIAERYETLFNEIKRRMTCTGKWKGLPALLDEMHSLRCEHRAELKQSTLALKVAGR